MLHYKNEPIYYASTYPYGREYSAILKIRHHKSLTFSTGSRWILSGGFNICLKIGVGSRWIRVFAISFSMSVLRFLELELKQFFFPRKTLLPPDAQKARASSAFFSIVVAFEKLYN